jgi:peptidoglycan hydrolase-like protein with peptidoglycan-binding domain
VFRSAHAKPNRNGWPQLLQAQATRLAASDVIWRDLFRTPAQALLTKSGAPLTLAPPSTFLVHPNLAAAASMAAVLTRIAGLAGTNSVLKLGDTGPSVAAWQRDLNMWIAVHSGARVLRVDGKFDQLTAVETALFQTWARIPADGAVGPVTRSALSRALAG